MINPSEWQELVEKIQRLLDEAKCDKWEKLFILKKLEKAVEIEG